MSDQKVRGAPFTLGSFAWRLAFTLVVVMATFNPTRYSYVQWLLSSRGSHSLALNTRWPGWRCSAVG